MSHDFSQRGRRIGGGLAVVYYARGSGHLYGTSLPVGGKNTHTVLTGHRGMVNALMFTRIDELNKGDDFYIKVMGRRSPTRWTRLP